MSATQTGSSISDVVAITSPAGHTCRDEVKKLVVTSLAIAVFAIAMLAFLLRQPAGFILDEKNYVPVARALLQGTVPKLPSTLEGWQHPPLGSYLIAIGLSAAGDNPMGWRIVPATFGMLTLVGMFLWSYLLLRDYGSALAATALTALNQFWFVMSRLAMLDVFFVAFSIWGVLGATAAMTPQFSVRFRRACILCSGVMFGLALACKWIALDTMVVVFAIAFGLMLISGRRWTANTELARRARGIREIGWTTLLIAAFALPLFGYLMPVCFELWQSLGQVSGKQLLALHVGMLKASKAFAGGAAMRAAWYSWPLRTTPFRPLSYLLGNFAVMWGGLAGLVICARRLLRGFRMPELMVLLLYAANLLQWAVTPIRTPLYYYYYPAAMILAPAAVLGFHRKQVFRCRVDFLLVAAASVMFLYCYPRMTYLQSPWDCMLGCWD